MPTDYYRQVYQKKLNYTGENLQEKAVSRGIKEFERYLAITPTRQEVLRNNDCLYVSIQKSQQTAVGDRYEKDILGKIEDKWSVGDIFDWADEKWIIISQNRLTVPNHFKGKIRLCNRYLKWNYNGEIYQSPGHIITSRAFAIEEGQKANITWEEGSMVVLATLPSNSQTNTINRYSRFIINNKAWRVVNTDSLSVDNLLFIRLEEDQINLAKDDLENEIADKYIPDESNENLIEGFIYSIDGPMKLVSNQTGEYIAKMDGEIASNVVFSVSDTTLADLIVENSINPTSIKANTQGIVGEFNIICQFIDTNKTISITVKVTSLWG
jgi:hypothetical protein